LKNFVLLEIALRVDRFGDGVIENEVFWRVVQHGG